MKFFVLIRENKKEKPDSPQRFLPVVCHWDRDWLKNQESEDNEFRWFVSSAETVK